MLVPKIPCPLLMKLPMAPPVLTKLPFVASSFVVPSARPVIVPDPDPTPPAVCKSHSILPTQYFCDDSFTNSEAGKKKMAIYMLELWP